MILINLTIWAEASKPAREYWLIRRPRKKI